MVMMAVYICICMFEYLYLYLYLYISISIAQSSPTSAAHYLWSCLQTYISICSFFHIEMLLLYLKIFSEPELWPSEVAPGSSWRENSVWGFGYLLTSLEKQPLLCDVVTSS